MVLYYCPKDITDRSVVQARACNYLRTGDKCGWEDNEELCNVLKSHQEEFSNRASCSILDQNQRDSVAIKRLFNFLH
jgi:hypothetical protein